MNEKLGDSNKESLAQCLGFYPMTPKATSAQTCFLRLRIKNPVSSTARMTFAFLCSRGMLQKDEKGQKQLWVGVSKKDIGRALVISEAVAERVLMDLEDLGIIRVERLGLKYKKEKLYCNFYNANRIQWIEDPGRWARIKAAQAECLQVEAQPTKWNYAVFDARSRPNLQKVMAQKPLLLDGATSDISADTALEGGSVAVSRLGNLRGPTRHRYEHSSTSPRGQCQTMVNKRSRCRHGANHDPNACTKNP